MCTKAGYLVPGAIPTGSLNTEDVVGGMHCLAPAFLSDQLERSRRNLGIETIDVFYLHNPETQLGYVSEDMFYERIRSAFELLERQVTAGSIRYYGAATWTVSERRAKAAVSRPDELHRARTRRRFAPLPLYSTAGQSRHDGERGRAGAGAGLGITVVASASLLQGGCREGCRTRSPRLCPRPPPTPNARSSSRDRCRA